MQALQGMIEHFDRPYQVALGLHACGNATDFVMLSALKQRAAYILCPCCVGKLKFSTAGGSSFSSQYTTWQVRPMAATRLHMSAALIGRRSVSGMQCLCMCGRGIGVGRTECG